MRTAPTNTPFQIGKCKNPKTNHKKKKTKELKARSGTHKKSNKGFMVNEADINNPIHSNSVTLNSNLVTVAQIKHSFGSLEKYSRNEN